MAQLSTIHVVDDDEALRDSLRLLFECEGFDVRTYASGPAFLRDASLAEHCCLLVDVHMPGMSGLELLEQLRKRGVMAPALVMTGMSDTHISQAAERLGAVLLEKPFRHDELIESIRQACQAGP